MQTMAGLDNIPRKEKQFRNLASNSLGLRGSNGKIVDEIWQCLKEEREQRLAAKEQHQEQQKQEKQLQQETPEETAEAPQNADETTSHPKDANLGLKVVGLKSNGKSDAKKVKSAAKTALKKAPNRSMKTKELRKLVGNDLPLLSKDRLKELLEQTTKSPNSKFKVDGKMISLTR